MTRATNLAWLFIIILIVLFFVFAIWLLNRSPGSEFGTYSQAVVGPCINTSGLCTDPGTRTSVQECIINEQTGKGCIGPDGKQSYDTLVTREECTLTCRSAVWEDITPAGQTCVIPPPLPNEAANNGRYCLPTIYPAGTPQAGLPVTGTRQLMYRCIANDDEGPNNCTQLALEQITGPTNVTGGVNVITTNDPSNTPNSDPPNPITIEENCDIVNPANPVCGSWVYFSNFTPANQPVVSSNQISSCSFRTTLINEQECITPAGGKENVFALLQEGYALDPMACLFGQGSGDQVYIPPDDAPATVECLQYTDYIGCNTQTFTPNQIAQKSIPTTLRQNPLVCQKSQNSTNFANNPRCYHPCRLYPVENPQLGNATFNALVNNPFIMYRGTNYVSGFQIPRTNNELAKFTNPSNPMVKAPSETLQATPLLMVPFGFTTNGPRPNCTEQNIAEDTAVLGLLGPVSVSGQTLLAKLSLSISSQYTGWLSQDTFNTLGQVSAWQQGYGSYDGPGETYQQSATYQIKIITPFDNTPVPGYPNSIGQTTLQIRSSNDIMLDPIVLNAGGTQDVFEQVTLILFNYSAVNFDCRNDNTANNCNLFNSTLVIPQPPMSCTRNMV